MDGKDSRNSSTVTSKLLKEKALAKDIENIEKSRKISRRDFEREKILLTTSLDGRSKPQSLEAETSAESRGYTRRGSQAVDASKSAAFRKHTTCVAPQRLTVPGGPESTLSSQGSDASTRSEHTDRSETTALRGQRDSGAGRERSGSALSCDRAAQDACDQMRTQYEGILTLLLDNDSFAEDKKLSFILADFSDARPITDLSRISAGSREMSEKIQRMVIEERFESIFGTVEEKGRKAAGGSPAVHGRQNISEKISVAQKRSSETVPVPDQGTPQRNPFAIQLMNMIKLLSEPGAALLTVKHFKPLKALAEECRLTVRCIKGGSDPSGRLTARTLKKLTELLETIKPGSSAEENVLSAEDALNCGYLRLSKEQVTRLEGQLRARGIDPGIHRHTNVTNFKIFEENPESQNLKPMTMHLPSTSMPPLIRVRKETVHEKGGKGSKI